MDVSAIAAMSTGMHQAQTLQSVDVTMTKKTMDLAETLATEMIQDFQQANPVASFGHALDVTV